VVAIGPLAKADPPPKLKRLRRPRSIWRFAEQMAGVENPLSADPSAAPPAPVRGQFGHLARAR
jgi:hypothetical protein